MSILAMLRQAFKRMGLGALAVAAAGAGMAAMPAAKAAPGDIYRYVGPPCAGSSCPGWQRLDNNPATRRITANQSLFQLHSTGRIWRWLGAGCSGSSCPSWQMLDNNGQTGRLAAGLQLYQLHWVRTPQTRARICYECK